MPIDWRDDLIGKYCGGYGNPRAKLMVVGEAPGPDEVSWRPEPRPFVGTTGTMLGDATAEAGLRLDDAYRTNVFKWYPPESNIKRFAETGHTLEEGLPQLYAEIESVNPNCILAVGDLALETLTGKSGIFTWRGSILPTKDGKRKVIPTVHPAALFKQKADGKGAIPWQFWYIIKNDIYKAVQDSEFPELRIPNRQHRICRGSVELQRFFDRHLDPAAKNVTRDKQGRVICSVDIESHHNIPILIAFAFNKDEAMSVPLFNVGSWRAPGKGLSVNEFVRIWRILHWFFSNPLVCFIGQNFKYDQEKIEQTLGFPIGHGRLHADVGMMSHVVQPEFRISLGFLASIYTREPFWKAEGKEFDITKHQLEQLMVYNCKDVLVTFELYECLYRDLEELNLLDFYFGYKNRLHDFYMDMERQGWRIDEDVRTALWEKYVKMHNDLLEELKEITGYYINFNSPDDVKWLMFKVLGLPERSNTEDETLALLSANHAKSDKVKRAIWITLRGRRVRKTLSTYLSALPDFDGRLRTSFRIPGTETDRTATHMLESPVRPEGFETVRYGGKKAKRVKVIGIMSHNMTKHGDVGGDFRSMLIPDDEDSCFGSADMSQAEARIVALLAGDMDLIKLFDTVDIHSLTASWLFNVPVPRVDKKGPLRQIAKSVRHAGNYGMGKRKLTELLAASSQRYDQDLTMSEWRAGQILDIFHRYTPKIREVFHVGVVEALKNNNRTLINAFGRPRTFHARWGDELFREAYADIPQSTVPEHLKMAGLRIKDRLPEIKFVNESHDELVWHCKKTEFDGIARVVKEEIEKPIDFSRCSISRGTLLIPAEVKIAEKNYKDFDDYKFGVAA